jgi:DNA-binding NarL/FixJ family response regulator
MPFSFYVTILHCGSRAISTPRQSSKLVKLHELAQYSTPPDDQPTVLQGLRMRLGLESDLVVVGEAEDGQTAIDLVSVLSPEVIVLDLEMPGMDGIATAQALRAIAPEGAVIILSIHGDIAARRRALAVGAVEFVEKNAGIEPLLAAIRRGRASASSTAQE